MRPHAHLLVGWLAFLGFKTALDLAQPLLLAYALQYHIIGGALDKLPLDALGFVGLIVGQNLTLFVQQWLVQLAGQRTMHDLRIAIFDHVLAQRAAFFDRIPVGRLMTRMTNDIESLNEIFSQGAITIIDDVIKAVAIVAISGAVTGKARAQRTADLSAMSAARPAASIAALTAAKASGVVSTSIAPSSGYTTTSSAPASGDAGLLCIVGRDEPMRLASSCRDSAGSPSGCSSAQSWCSSAWPPSACRSVPDCPPSSSTSRSGSCSATMARVNRRCSTSLRACRHCRWAIPFLDPV